ncbi:MAG: hypothetical protein AUH17_07180 [Actinobacteria bacterium 13_2_20CM_68_14]|nr:MAG: hypothetical protein AUH17_07180 [Actinobacteria bacterium 13_2_20CM_68_14]
MPQLRRQLGDRDALADLDRGVAVPQVVRREVRDTGRSAGPRHQARGAAGREAREDAPLRGAVVGRAGGLDLGHQPGGHCHPAAARGRLAPTDAKAAAGDVDVPPLELGEFTDPHPGLLEYPQRKTPTLRDVGEDASTCSPLGGSISGLSTRGNLTRLSRAGFGSTSAKSRTWRRGTM